MCGIYTGWPVHEIICYVYKSEVFSNNACIAYLSVANGIVCHSNINITVVLINIYVVAIKA